MRVLIFVLFATFCASKLQALIVDKQAIINKVLNKEYYHVDYQNYFDFSEFILNDDGSPLPSALWCCCEYNFFEDLNDSIFINVIVADVDERCALLFRRNDDASGCLMLDQIKFSDNDQVIVASTITKMKAELNAFLDVDEEDPASRLKSLEDQIHSIEQAPYMYEPGYFDNLEMPDEGVVEGDDEEIDEAPYVMSNYLYEYLEELKVTRDSLTDYTQQLLSLDQILARLSVEDATQHFSMAQKLIILQSLGFF